MNVPEYTFSRLEEICGKFPDRTAIIYLGEKISYRKLWNWIVNLLPKWQL